MHLLLTTQLALMAAGLVSSIPTALSKSMIHHLKIFNNADIAQK